MCSAAHLFIEKLNDYQRASSFKDETKIEAYIRSNIVSRIASPIIALSESVKGVVKLSLDGVAHIIGGAITFNGKQVAVGLKRGHVLVVTAVALPLIGLEGLASPNNACNYADRLNSWTSKTLCFHPRYSKNQARIILLVLTATRTAEIATNFIVDTITEIALNAIKAVGSVVAKVINGVRGARTLSPEILEEFRLNGCLVASS